MKHIQVQLSNCLPTQILQSRRLQKPANPLLATSARSSSGTWSELRRNHFLSLWYIYSTLFSCNLSCTRYSQRKDRSDAGSGLGGCWICRCNWGRRGCSCRISFRRASRGGGRGRGHGWLYRRNRTRARFRFGAGAGSGLLGRWYTVLDDIALDAGDMVGLLPSEYVPRSLLWLLPDRVHRDDWPPRACHHVRPTQLRRGSRCEAWQRVDRSTRNPSSILHGEWSIGLRIGRMSVAGIWIFL